MSLKKDSVMQRAVQVSLNIWVPGTSEKLPKSLKQCQHFWRQGGDYLYMPVVTIPWLFFKACLLEICKSNGSLAVVKLPCFPQACKRMLLKCPGHVRFQSQTSKATASSSLFLLSCCLYGYVGWWFGYCINPLSFKASTYGTCFALSVVTTGAEDVVMAFSRSETEDRRQ